MLNDNLQRAVVPAQIAPLIPWKKLDGVIILCKGKVGELNHVVMSTLTVEEMCFLHAQLSAHINGLLLGSLQESIPFEGVPAEQPAPAPVVPVDVSNDMPPVAKFVPKFVKPTKRKKKK